MKLGLCLAGGGIKGAAHIGVLKAFEEMNIKIDMISGASSGSIVASLYSMGYSYKEIYLFFKEYAKKVKYIDVFNIFKLLGGFIFENKIIIKGLTKGKKLENFIKEKCIEKNLVYINDIKFPIFISSVDLNTGDTYIFNNSNCNNHPNFKLIKNIEISKAVRASCSYPGIFEPVKWNNTELIDGGVNENIPWSIMKKCGADKIICVVFKNTEKKVCCKNMINVIECSWEYLNKAFFDYEINGSGELIEIETESINLLDYTKIDCLYELGYTKAKEKLLEFRKVQT